MVFYSYCAGIPEDEEKLQNATVLLIDDLVNNPECLSNIRSKYGFYIDNQEQEVRQSPLRFPGLAQNNFGPVYRINDEQLNNGVTLGNNDVRYAHVNVNVDKREVDFVTKSPNFIRNFEETRSNLLSEAKVCANLDHANIIKFYGLLFDNNPREMKLMFEYMDKGHVHSYLRSNVEVSLSDRFTIAYQLAQGLAYMATKNYVHRNISAKNCLLKQDPAGLVAKIGDMGMSRNLYCKGFYVPTERINARLRWQSPENIEASQFSPESDLWSFGIVLWEIATFCQNEPYPDADEASVVKIIKSGNQIVEKMPCPKNFPQELRKLMIKCWKMRLDERIKIADLRERLKLYLEKLQTCS